MGKKGTDKAVKIVCKNKNDVLGHFVDKDHHETKQSLLLSILLYFQT